MGDCGRFLTFHFEKLTAMNLVFSAARSLKMATAGVSSLGGSLPLLRKELGTSPARMLAVGVEQVTVIGSGSMGAGIAQVRPRCLFVAGLS